jgi:hypothetical protein
VSIASSGSAFATTSSRRKGRLVIVAAAVLGAAAVWSVVDPILGIDLRSPANAGRESMDVGPSLVVLAAAIASFIGWAALALLERLTSRARVVWAVGASLLLLASLGPLSRGRVSRRPTGRRSQCCTLPWERF